MTLFEINNEIRSILDFVAVDEETGELIGSIDFARINELNLERTTKIENLALFAKELMVEIDAIKAEAKTLKERAEVKANKLEDIKSYLSFILTDNGETRFETPRTALSFRKSEVVEIDESKLPKKYMKKKIEITPDKVGIRKLLKSGVLVRGASLVEKQNLQIK